MYMHIHMLRLKNLILIDNLMQCLFSLWHLWNKQKKLHNFLFLMPYLCRLSQTNVILILQTWSSAK